MAAKKKQCKGWRRYSVFTFGGTTKWRQCKEDAIVTLEGTQVDADASNKWVPFKQPACQHCWDEAKDYDKMNIIKATPIRRRKAKEKKPKPEPPLAYLRNYPVTIKPVRR